MTKVAIIIWIFTQTITPHTPERMYAFTTGSACEEARAAAAYFPSNRCIPYMEVIPSRTVPSWKKLTKVVPFDPTVLNGE